MWNLTNLILILTALTTALMAGLFYAWSCSVIPGLSRLPDADYLRAMQELNRAIQNPVFFAGFMGTLLLLPLSAWLNYGQPGPLRFWLLLAAALTYTIGVFGVTVFGNIPLNNALDVFNLPAASGIGIAAQRVRFEGAWNALNSIRTLASILSVLFVIIACLSRADKGAKIPRLFG